MPRGTDISPLALLLRRIDAIADGAHQQDGVPTGFPSIDRVLGGGVRRGDLVVIGGDVGSGKSALALAMAYRAAEAGHPVAFYSGEMSHERLLERLLGIEGRARVDDMRRGSLDDATRATVGAAAVRLRELPLALEWIPGRGIEGIAEELEGRGRKRPALLVVDPLQMLALGDAPTDEVLGVAVRRLKRLAVESEVAVLLTSHLPGLAARQDPRPQLDDFGARGAVKEHADIVLGLFREGMYDGLRALEGATEVLVRKSRSGATGYVDLYFYSQWMRFEDMLDPDR